MRAKIKNQYFLGQTKISNCHHGMVKRYYWSRWFVPKITSMLWGGHSSRLPESQPRIGRVCLAFWKQACSYSVADLGCNMFAPAISCRLLTIKYSLGIEILLSSDDPHPLTLYLTYFLTIYLALCPPLYLKFCRTCFLTHYLAFYLTCYLTYFLTFIWHHSIRRSIWHFIRNSKEWHSIWHFNWHLFWHYIWHSFWHSIWHVIWIIFGHSFWHPFWHSIWHVFWYSLYVLTFYLAFFYCGILYNILYLRAQECSTASGARDMEFGSRRAPQHPELAISRSSSAGPLISQSRRAGRRRKQRGGGDEDKF